VARLKKPMRIISRSLVSTSSATGVDRKVGFTVFALPSRTDVPTKDPPTGVAAPPPDGEGVHVTLTLLNESIADGEIAKSEEP